MNHSHSTSNAITKHKRHWSFLLLCVFCMQAMFAKGLMPGNGTWVELCTSDSTSVSLIYLANGEIVDSSEHHSSDEAPCLFSAFSSVALQALEFPQAITNNRFLVSENFHPFANRQFWPARLSRAPPGSLS